MTEMSSANGFKVLPASAGYGIVIGIGGIFAILMLSITWLQNRYVGAFLRVTIQYV